MADQEEIEFFGFPVIRETCTLPICGPREKTRKARRHGLEPELVRLDVPISFYNPRTVSEG
eukprot:10504828-Heterocapsa_arctica.AAC.1